MDMEQERLGRKQVRQYAASWRGSTQARDAALRAGVVVDLCSQQESLAS